MHNIVICSLMAAVICLVAAIFDVKTGKIPNKITFPVIIIGLIISVVFKTTVWWQSLIAIVVLFAFGATGITGLGDIKLMMAITAVGGWQMCLWSFIFGCFLLCIFGIFSKPVETYIYIKKSFRRIFRLGFQPLDKNKVKYKFAPFMFIGIILYTLIVCHSGSVLHFLKVV